MKASILLLAGSLICFMPGVAGAQNKVDYCEPATVVKEELKKLLMKDDEDLTERQKFERRMSMLPKVLQQYPEDFFIRKAYLDYRNNNYFPESEKLREEYRLLFEQRPKDPVAVYLYSRLLVGYKTKEAIEILNKAVAESPDFPWSYIQLAYVYNTPVFRDQAKAKENLQKWFSICPNQRERLWLVAQIGVTELMAEPAKRLRVRLESSAEADDLTLWGDLWSWEFRLKPVPEHAQVRTKIAEDLKNLRAKDLGGKERLIVLRSGYKMVNDKEGTQWVEDEMARRYPKSPTLLAWLQERWQEANPWPAPDAPEEKKQAFYQARLKAVNEWLKQWPNERRLWVDKFFAGAEIEGFPNVELQAIGEKVLKLSEDEDFFSVPTIQVAQAYTRHNMATERIPSLILKVFEEMERYAKSFPPSDLYKREDEKEDSNLRYLHWQSWPLLVEAYAKLKQSDKAREVLGQMVDSLKKLKPADNAKASEKSLYAAHQVAYWQAAGKLADIENRKLDALGSYQTALSFRENTPKTKDQLRADIDRLWKELGGTEEGRNALLSRNEVKKAAEATEESWDTANKPLADFALTDLQGKKWQLADLKGKTTFINFWASWCGPCRQELPYVERLHEQMKDKKDVLILTFNIDDEVGMVEPFMKENKYTFTVILGPEYASSQEVYGIPRNWIVGPGGAIRFDGIGFGGDVEGFLKKAIAAIEKAKEKGL